MNTFKIHLESRSVFVSTINCNNVAIVEYFRSLKVANTQLRLISYQSALEMSESRNQYLNN